MKLDLPPIFIKNITNTFPEGEEWLARLPDLISEAIQRWNLTGLQTAPTLSYNYVAFGRQHGKKGYAQDVVLKIGVPNRELSSEMTALQLYAGEGACKLYDSDPEKGMLLEEHLHPGTMLHASGMDDAVQTVIAAETMRRLWRPVPEDARLISLRDWFDELAKLRPAFGGTTGPFPARLVEATESLLPGLFADPDKDVVLHGDCHHFNILRSERGWLVIDPKGVVGPAGYEPAPLMLNPWEEFARLPDAVTIAERRLRILAEVLDIDVKELHAWAICHSLLSAWWDTGAGMTGGEYSTACGEIFLKIKF
jgi:streptomycin 6-kinase